jgi:hypothetical protein
VAGSVGARALRGKLPVAGGFRQHVPVLTKSSRASLADSGLLPASAHLRPVGARDLLRRREPVHRQPPRKMPATPPPRQGHRRCLPSIRRRAGRMRGRSPVGGCGSDAGRTIRPARDGQDARVPSKAGCRRRPARGPDRKSGPFRQGRMPSRKAPADRSELPRSGSRGRSSARKGQEPPRPSEPPKVTPTWRATRRPSPR